jgi:hypothetical protein
MVRMGLATWAHREAIFLGGGVFVCVSLSFSLTSSEFQWRGWMTRREKGWTICSSSEKQQYGAGLRWRRYNHLESNVYVRIQRCCCVSGPTGSHTVYDCPQYDHHTIRYCLGAVASSDIFGSTLFLQHSVVGEFDLSLSLSFSFSFRPGLFVVFCPIYSVWFDQNLNL